MALAQKAASAKLATRRTTAAVARPAVRKAVVVRAAAQSNKVTCKGSETGAAAFPGSCFGLRLCSSDREA